MSQNHPVQVAWVHQFQFSHLINEDNKSTYIIKFSWELNMWKLLSTVLSKSEPWMIDCSYHFIDGKSQFLKNKASEADTGDNRFRISKRINLGLNIRVENTCILLLSIYSKCTTQKGNALRLLTVRDYFLSGSHHFTL